MYVSVGDISLFVEVVGTKLSVKNGEVLEKPTVVLLHGGPAWDHLTLLPEFQSLQDCAQLVFYDHRGLGRSGLADQRTWTLHQWAADLKQLVETLGIDRPIIFGQSFGGMVAQQFATDYPGSFSGLILSATAARFDLEGAVETFRALGGEHMATLARSFFTASNADHRDQFRTDCMPYYTANGSQIGQMSPFRADVLDHFFSAVGDAHRFDFRDKLAAVRTPTLIMGGDSDPVISPAAVRETAESFRSGVATLRIFENCGHGPTRDRPVDALALMRWFITEGVRADLGST
jgi:proline iminopeptidase